MAKRPTPDLAQRLEKLLSGAGRENRPSKILRDIESAAVSQSDEAQEVLSDLIEWLREAERLAEAGKLAEKATSLAAMEKRAERELPALEAKAEKKTAKSSPKKPAVELIGPPKKKSVKEAKLFTDGGARGNPGPAAIGIVMEDAEDKIVWTHGEAIGKATNNVAEYRALIHALEVAGKIGVERLNVFSDSELVVKQLNGEYRVKNLALKPLVAEVQSLRRRFAYCRFQHIPRAQNKTADRLANQALDEAAGRS